jgi:hypothetical protein
MEERFSTFRAKFAPKRTDDLKKRFLKYVGSTYIWRRIWIIDNGMYEGEWACEIDAHAMSDKAIDIIDIKLHWFWAPESDLTKE